MSGPVPYDRLRQRVRRHRTSHVLAGVAALNAQLELAQHGQAQPLSLPKCVTPFALAGVAWTALT